MDEWIDGKRASKQERKKTGWMDDIYGSFMLYQRCVSPHFHDPCPGTAHEFLETCHSVTFYFMKKRLQTMTWHLNVRVNSHQRWKQTRFRVCFHLWCELTSTMNVTEWQVSWNWCYGSPGPLPSTSILGLVACLSNLSLTGPSRLFGQVKAIILQSSQFACVDQIKWWKRCQTSSNAICFIALHWKWPHLCSCEVSLLM